jgi:hypothetical protein
MSYTGNHTVWHNTSTISICAQKTLIQFILYTYNITLALPPSQAFRYTTVNSSFLPLYKHTFIYSSMLTLVIYKYNILQTCQQ